MAGAGVSQSFNNSRSSTTSTPEAIQTPQSNWELQLSQLLGQLGQNQYTWAQQQFGNAQDVTDQQINNYLTAGNYGLNMASNLSGRYQNIFEPLENQYVTEAGSYASQPRINFNMGQAQSNAAQAGTQALNNTRQQLQQFGINPSSGMYGELEEAGNAQRAASAAGAGQEAGLATEQTGRQMLQNAISMGQQLPGATVNALNSAYGGISGAENSILGLENTGATLTDSASPYFNSAMNLKLPPVANQLASTSSSSGSTNSRTGGQYGPQNNSNGTGGKGPSGNYMKGGSGVGGPGVGGGPYTGPGSQSNIDLNMTQPGWDTFGTGQGADTTGTLDTSSFVDPNLSTSDFGTYNNPTFGGYGGQSYSPSNMGAYGGYARGGGVIPRGPTTGGAVPSSASPSLGANTDDIPARLNADEFVIPRDVKRWKGEEYFQKLINDSRKAMATPGQNGAQGQMKPPLAGPPRFVSHNAPQGVIPGRQ